MNANRLLFECLTFLDEELRRTAIPTELSQRRNALCDRLREYAAERPLQHGAGAVVNPLHNQGKENG